ARNIRELLRVRVELRILDDDCLPILYGAVGIYLVSVSGTILGLSVFGYRLILFELEVTICAVLVGYLLGVRRLIGTALLFSWRRFHFLAVILVHLCLRIVRDVRELIRVRIESGILGDDCLPFLHGAVGIDLVGVSGTTFDLGVLGN